MIREATPQDYSAVAALANHLQETHIAARPDVLRNEMFFTPEHFQQHLENEDTNVFVYEVDGKMQGYCITKMVNYQQHMAYHDMRVCVIGAICVCENARGKGIGRELFDHAKAHAEKCGSTRIELNVWDFNKSAKEFYEHLGFTTKTSTMEMNLL